ncbi:MAG: DUF4101 domain-containing protein [Candidatus Melainabacteria bacterium]|nr:DUF4101 domain-containing protein [Candidatus Melainabacteria bacterium]
MRRTHHGLVFRLTAAMVLAAVPGMTMAADSQTDGSLNELWNNEGTAQQPARESGGGGNDNFKLYQPETTTSSSPDKAEAASTVAPLCTLGELKKSDFVSTGGWPGVGPFSQDKENDNQLVDEARNTLKFSTTGQDITEAELTMVNQPADKNDLLSLQMNADFLLEALGAQDARIADFNNAFENKQEDLKSGSVNLNAGTYDISIARARATEQTEPGSASYVIKVRNTRPVIAEKPPEPVTPVKEDEPEKTPAPRLVASDPATGTEKPSALDKPVTLAMKSAPTATEPKAAESSDTDANKNRLIAEFTDLMQRWQLVKKATVKSRQSTNLTQILGGRALSLHTRAVGTLLNNHMYYEITPRRLKVESFKEITPGTKYLVRAHIEERRQFVNADTMSIQKDEEHSYNVEYTVEKVRGTWLIIDFSK